MSKRLRFSLLQKRHTSKGQALLEYVLLLIFFVFVLYVFMKFGKVLAGAFGTVAKSLARTVP